MSGLATDNWLDCLSAWGCIYSCPIPPLCQDRVSLVFLYPCCGGLHSAVMLPVNQPLVLASLYVVTTLPCGESELVLITPLLELPVALPLVGSNKFI